MKLIILVFTIFLTFSSQIVQAANTCEEINHPDCVEITECGYLDVQGRYYLLMNDVYSDTSCFAVLKDDITLDLNQYKITYDNRPPIEVVNGGFEIGGGWDFSSSPSASIQEGTYIQPRTLYSGNYALKYDINPEDQYFTSLDSYTLEPNTSYVLSAMFFVGAADSGNCDSVVAYVGFEGFDDFASLIGRARRGFQLVYYRYVTGTSPETYKIISGISNAQNCDGELYVDDIKIRKYSSLGVTLGPGGDMRYTPDFPMSAVARNFKIFNGSIIQGIGNGMRSHALYMYRGNADVKNLNLTVNGSDTSAIRVNSYSNISNSIINSFSDTTSSRDQGYLATIKLRDQNSKADSIMIINNTITSGFQTGINLGGSTENYHYIVGNNIKLSSKFTNDFAIMSPGVISGNFINCSGEGLSCRGIASSVNSEVSNNEVHVQELERNQEYNGCELMGAYGIQLENDKTNISVFNNSIFSYARECDAHSFRINTVSSENMLVENNTFVAISYSDELVASSTLMDATRFNSEELIFRNNELLTNDVWIEFDNEDYFGEKFSKDLIFDGNKFSVIEPLTDPFHPLVTYKGADSNGTVFLNNRYDSLEEKQLFESFSFRDYIAPNRIRSLSSFYISWTLEVELNDLAGQVLKDQLVEVEDSAGKVITSLTNSEGVAIFQIPEFYNFGGVLTEFNPYKVRALSQERIIAINEPTELLFIAGFNQDDVGIFDLNGDFVVDIDDLYLLAQFFGLESDFDITGDGIVNVLDMVILVNNFD